MPERKILEIKPLVDEKIIKETISRIGIANKKQKVLFPSCYLYKKDDKFYLAHFKELFSLEREDAYDNVGEKDIVRRNAIAYCLKQWGLIEVSDEEIEPHDEFVFVLPFKEKKEWEIQHKYNVRSLYDSNNENQETEHE